MESEDVHREDAKSAKNAKKELGRNRKTADTLWQSGSQSDAAF
jgi:hypothetical protein